MEIQVKKMIRAKVEKVWRTVRSFDHVDLYLPMVDSCRVEGTGVGGRRLCTLRDGVRILERLELVDDAAKRIRYSIVETWLLVRNYLATISVRETTDGRCEVEWSATVESRGAPEEAIKKFFSDAFASGIEGLEKLHSER